MFSIKQLVIVHFSASRYQAFST